MSKKDKKRIGELERQQSILLATMRVLRKDFNTLSLSIVQDKIDAIRAANSFQAGTIPSEKEQEKTEQSDQSQAEKLRQTFVRLGRNWGRTSLNFLEKAMAEKEQGKTEQPQQSEAEKEQELMAQLNKELAKFATLEAFNTERANRGLPAIDKLEFDKAKSAFDYAIATAKVLRPQWYDKIDQIKIPQTEQDKPEQSQPKKTKLEPFAVGKAVLKDIENKEVAYSKKEWLESQKTAERLRSKYEYMQSEFVEALFEEIEALNNKLAVKEAEQSQPERDSDGMVTTSEESSTLRGMDLVRADEELAKNHRENLGEPVLNKPKQFKTNRISPEEREENIAKEDWESRKQISAEQLSASLSKLASLPLKSEQELAEAKRANRINAALKDAVDDLTKHLNFTLENFGKDRARQVEMLQAYCDHFKEDLSDFRRKVLSVSELGGTWLIYDKIDKAWAAKCSEGGFYWSSEQDDFVLKFTSEEEANQRYDALCSRGIISVMHRANSGVIRKE